MRHLEGEAVPGSRSLHVIAQARGRTPQQQSGDDEEYGQRDRSQVHDPTVPSHPSHHQARGDPRPDHSRGDEEDPVGEDGPTRPTRRAWALLHEVGGPADHGARGRDESCDSDAGNSHSVPVEVI